MTRRSRADGPATLHHVYNRAIAKRTMFESERDMRFFLALVARACRRREIRVHAFCLLGTHFHLFVLSRRGELGRVMQRIQTSYSRYFNRLRRRDGPLVRGRYSSRPVVGERYACTLSRYIELNAAAAGIESRPERYEFCSAAARRRAAPPRWLQSLYDFDYQPMTAVEDYQSELEALEFIVERRLKRGSSGPAREFPAAPSNENVRSWLIRKAALADGTRPGIPVADPATVRSVAESLEVARIEKLESGSKRLDSRRRRILFGLLRDLAGLGVDEIAIREGVSRSTVVRALSGHRKDLVDSPSYADFLAELARLVHARGADGASRREEGGK